MRLAFGNAFDFRGMRRIKFRRIALFPALLEHLCVDLVGLLKLTGNKIGQLRAVFRFAFEIADQAAKARARDKRTSRRWRLNCLAWA